MNGPSHCRRRACAAGGRRQPPAPAGHRRRLPVVAGGEAGSITAFVAVLAVALFAVAGLTVDGGRALAAREQLAAMAEQAARAGAAAVSAGALHGGEVTIDPTAATAVAGRYLSLAGVQGHVSASATEVTVTVVRVLPTTILGILGITALTVHARAVATDLHGVVQGG